MRFNAEGAAATDAPVAAVDGTSLGVAFAGVVSTDPATNKTTLTVDIANNIELKAEESLDAIIDAEGTTAADNYVVDLNGNTITQSADTQLATGKNLTFTNGTIAFTAESKDGASSMINPEGDATLTLDGVTLTTASGTAIYAEDTNVDSARAYPTIVINNSTITAAGQYGVSTNAKNAIPSADWQKFSITITNSTITAGSATVPGTALFINVPSDVRVENSTLNASYQAVVVRGGSLNLSNTTLNLTEYTADETVSAENYATMVGTVDTGVVTADGWKDGFVTGVTDLQTYRMAGIWGQGNALPRATIVVGNSNSTAYQYTSYVRLSGVTFANEDAAKIIIGSHYSAATMGNATAGWNTMVTVDATGMGLDASEITYCFNTVFETVSTTGFVKAN